MRNKIARNLITLSDPVSTGVWLISFIGFVIVIVIVIVIAFDFLAVKFGMQHFLPYEVRKA